jgi:hypothetical protein
VLRSPSSDFGQGNMFLCCRSHHVN